MFATEIHSIRRSSRYETSYYRQEAKARRSTQASERYWASNTSILRITVLTRNVVGQLWRVARRPCNSYNVQRARSRDY